MWTTLQILRAGWTEMKRSKIFNSLMVTQDHMTDIRLYSWCKTSMSGFFFPEWNEILSLFRKTSDPFRFIKWYLQLLVQRFRQKQWRMYVDSELNSYYDIRPQLHQWRNSPINHINHEIWVSRQSRQTRLFDYVYWIYCLFSHTLQQRNITQWCQL